MIRSCNPLSLKQWFRRRQSPARVPSERRADGRAKLVEKSLSLSPAKLLALALTGLALAVTTSHAQDAAPTNAQLQSRIEALEKELAALKALVEKPPTPAAAPSTPPVPTRSPITTSADVKFRFSGFLQMRAFDSQTTTIEPHLHDDFDLRRAQLNLSGDLGKRAAARFSFDIGRTGFATRDAYLEYHVSPALLLRAGQFKLPVSYEVLQSAADLPALERALVNQRLYPGNRDRGFMADWNLGRHGTGPLSVQLGAVNGVGPNQLDNNDGKEFFSSLFYKTSHFDARLAYSRGTFLFAPSGGAPSFNSRKDRLSLSAHAVLGGERLWDISGQYSRGHGDFPLGGGAPRLTGTLGPTGAFNPVPVSGYYLLLMHRLQKDSPLSLWVKRDVFDPNRRVSGDDITINSIGVWWDVDSHVSLSGGLFHKDFPGVGQENSVGLQTQVRF